MSAILKEHIDYLALQGRSAAYDRAIAKTIRTGDVVADLGCGVGVLGLACLRAGAAKVYGIDKSDAIAIARETMAREGLAQSYTCIRGSTFDTTLPEAVDAIICDHVGWFGFDYGIIAMLRDARRRLLKPGGVMVPRALRLMIASTSSEAARALAEAWRHDPVPAEYHWLEEYGLNTKHPYYFAAEEIASAPTILGDVDLSADTPDDFRFTATLTATSAHTMQGIAGWFACELAEDVWLTNSPTEEAAIARNQVFLPVREPIVLDEGEAVDIRLHFRFDSEMFSWSVRGPDGRRQKMSTFNSTILSDDDLGRSEPC